MAFDLLVSRVPLPKKILKLELEDGSVLVELLERLKSVFPVELQLIIRILRISFDKSGVWDV